MNIYKKMDTNFKNLFLHDIKSDCTKAYKIKKETAEKEIGITQNKKNK